MSDLINIIDVPLKDVNNDKLNTRKYVEGLAQYLSKSAMPTTVAIQGQWGSGKTSCVRIKLPEMIEILCTTVSGSTCGNIQSCRLRSRL